MPPRESSHKDQNLMCLVGGVTMVALAYGLILGLSLWRTGHFAPVVFPDEKLYIVRTLDAYRGNSLGNPYIAEHESAVQYMPTVGERTLATTANLLRIAPLTIVGLSRMVLPIAIFLLVYCLARHLQMDPGAALVAGLVAVLMPSIKGNPFTTDIPLPLRYFRVISPAFFVLMMLIALRCIHWVCESGRLLACISAGLVCGLLFYTQVYYWTFIGFGVLLLAIRQDSSTRTRLTLVCLLAVGIGLPNLVHLAKIRHNLEVRQTLRRAGILVRNDVPLPPPPDLGRIDPSLDPDLTAHDISTLPRFVIGMVVCVVVWSLRKRIQPPVVEFVLPFCVAGTLLLEQHIVTGREVQDIHWLGCLIPFWAIAAAATVNSIGWQVRRVTVGIIALVFLSGVVAQSAAYRTLEICTHDEMEWWDLSRRMPATLKWLNENSEPDTVVISRPAIMDSLPLFTHNRLYFTGVAAQHVISDAEVASRVKSAQQWNSDPRIPLPYHADFAIQTDIVCEETALKKLYVNPNERTCVLELSQVGRLPTALVKH
jgi:hypothetical protein